MPFRKKSTDQKAPSTTVIGRTRFAAISAVEGIALTAPMQKRIKEFDRQGLSSPERRKAIIDVHKKS